VYIRFFSSDDFIIICVYVDDLLIVGHDPRVKDVKISLSSMFKMVDLGEASWLLGIQITRDRASRSIYLSQQKYVTDLLDRFSMTTCKSLSTPFNDGLPLSKTMSPTTADEMEQMRNVPYRSAVGALMYAMTCTRPDIAVAVSRVSCFMQNPGELHWAAVKRIFRYLHGTSQFVLRLSASSDVVLSGYCDADFAGCIDTRRSTYGYCFSLGVGLVSWCSKRLKPICTSTTQAEYLAIGMATRECMWLRSFLDELHFPQSSPTVIHEDNNGCMSLAKNPTDHSRAKHIDIQFHFVREAVKDGVINIVRCPTDLMVADALTKPVNPKKHEFCLRGFGLTTL
jgi:hypothetical protein